MLFHLALLASLPLSQASLSWVYARGSRQKNNGGDQGISYGECRRVHHDYLQLRGTQRMELPRRNSRRSCKGRVSVYRTTVVVTVSHHRLCRDAGGIFPNA